MPEEDVHNPPGDPLHNGREDHPEEPWPIVLRSLLVTKLSHRDLLSGTTYGWP
jgi:hypothetical protein